MRFFSYCNTFAAYSLATLILLGPQLNAEPLETTFNIGTEVRNFFQSPRFNDQVEDIQASISFQPEIKWQNDDRNQRFSLIGFSRVDSADDERNHSDIREFLYAHSWDSWTLTTGVNKVFWGVTESVHLVDIINQTDFVEDIDQEDKLGQPMIQASTQQSWGQLELFILPYFRERTFPSSEGRFYLGLPIHDEPLYESDDEEKHIDFAARYSHYFGDIDIGLHIFEGTNREPQLWPRSDNILVPFYSQITQFGLDAQYTYDAWLLKLEALHRDSKFDEFFASVGGFEYTLFQIADSPMDLGLLVEYQHDDRDQSVTLSLADNDVFLASRLAFNDAQDTSILAGVVIDTETSSQFINIEAERRFGSRLSTEFRARLFTNIDQEDPTDLFAQDDYVQLSLNWFL